jgi:AraC-like DNA-binding protein/ligand-binding sensor protein
MNTNKTLVDQLADSDWFREYEKAYNMATGMPLALHAVGSFALPFHGRRQENGFCALMARKNRTCSSCLKTQERLRNAAAEKTAITTCALGLSEAAVPVRLGDKVIGLLQTGQVLPEQPTAKKVVEVLSKVDALGVEESSDVVKKMYLKTPVVSRERLQSQVRMLGVFAELLSIKSNQIAVTESHAEHPVVIRAKQVVEERQGEDVTLGEVAKEVHVSIFHLCKLFRRSTGMTFTEYVSRTRTEKAKGLLLNPQLRISEIAYEVGFQSLTHFNRIFKKLVGQSPTRYRMRSGSHRPLNAPMETVRRAARGLGLLPQLA